MYVGAGHTKRAQRALYQLIVPEKLFVGHPCMASGPPDNCTCTTILKAERALVPWRHTGCWTGATCTWATHWIAAFLKVSESRHESMHPYTAIRHRRPPTGPPTLSLSLARVHIHGMDGGAIRTRAIADHHKSMRVVQSIWPTTCFVQITEPTELRVTHTCDHIACARRPCTKRP